MAAVTVLVVLVAAALDADCFTAKSSAIDVHA